MDINIKKIDNGFLISTWIDDGDTFIQNFYPTLPKVVKAIKALLTPEEVEQEGEVQNV